MKRLIARIIGTACAIWMGSLAVAQNSELEISVNWVNWASDNKVEVFTPSGTLIASICDPTNCETTLTNSTYSTTINVGCYPDASNYYLVATDAFGDGWNGTGNFVTVTGGGTNLITYDLTTGSSSGNRFFNVSGGGSCPANDALIFSISSPESGCSLGVNETVQVTIRNNGTNAITSCPVEYQIDGGGFVSAGSYSGSIASGATDTYQFTADFSAVGQRTLDVKTSLPSDGNSSNDTVSGYTVYNSEPHDFNAGELTMGFETNENVLGWTIVNDNMDTFTWDLDNTDAPNSGSQAANYTYNPSAAADDWLFTPCLDLEVGSTYELSYFYRVQSGFYPEDMDVVVMNSTTPGTPVSTIAAYTNLTNTTYTQEIQTFTVASNGTYYVAFHANSPADQWDIYIDDFRLRKVVDDDAGVIAVALPTSSCALGTSETVTATIENFGNNVVNNIPMEYRINNGSWTSAGTYTGGNIASGGTATYNFTVDLSSTGVYNLDVRTQLAGDGVAGNDEWTGESTENLAPFDFGQGVLSMGFEASDDESVWVTINNNGDAQEWDIDGTLNPNSGSEAANYRRSNSDAADDWIITPCLDFETGKSYQVSFYYRAQNSGFAERLTVYLMSDQTAGSTVNTIVDLNTFNNTSYQQSVNTFTVPSSGTYYIGFQAASPASRRRLYLDDILIKDETNNWLGNSSDWNEASNWSDAVPSATNDVLIPASPIGGNQPQITGSALCNDIVIESGADLQFGASGVLGVNGNWTNNSTFDPQNGTVSFEGTTSLQTITGATTFNNITLDNNLGTTASSGNLDIRGALTLTNGALNTNGLVTLISDALGTARIAPVTGGSINGNMIVQRYIDAGATNWRFLTSPVSGVDFEAWDDDFVTTGFVGSDFPSFSFISIQGYDETATGVSSNGWDPLTNSSDPINAGAGFLVFCGDNLNGTQPFTIDVEGPPYIGNVNIPVTYTSSGGATEDGWTLVGNPYASVIDWDSPNWTKTNMNNAIYVWDPDNDQYASYISGVGTNNGDRYIASGQAFWVQANGTNPVLEATENVKHDDTTPFFDQEAPKDLLRVTLNGNNKFDEIVVRFKDGFQTGFEFSSDALKRFSTSYTAPQFATIMTNSDNNSQYLSINSLPELTAETQGLSIPLLTYTPITGSYTFNFDGIESFAPDACLFLEDTQNGTFIDMRTQSSYTAIIQSYQLAPRFFIHIQGPGETQQLDASCFGETDGIATALGYGTAPWDFTWTKANGALIAQVNSQNNSHTISGLGAGDYSVHITGQGLCTSTSIDFTIAEPEPVIANMLKPNQTVYLQQGAEVKFKNLSRNASSFVWDFGDGNTSAEESPTHSYTATGNYRVNLRATNENGCEQSINGQVNVLREQGRPSDSKTEEGEQMPGDNQIQVQNNVTSVEIAFDLDTPESWSISLRNSLGQQVIPTQTVQGYNNRLNLDLEGLAQGIYILDMHSTNQQRSEKIYIR